MKRHIFLITLLLPMLVWAQTDVPCLSSISDTRSYTQIPRISDDILGLSGPVKHVECDFGIPYLIRTYGLSCFEYKHRIKDQIQSEHLVFQYDSTGALREITNHYVLYSYYFNHKTGTPYRKKNQKIHTDVFNGTAFTKVENGQVVHFSDYIPDHTYNAGHVTYDSSGNPVKYYSKKNFYEEWWSLSYDSLQRLVYIGNWTSKDHQKDLPQKVFSLLYEGGKCTAKVADMPSGTPEGDMRLLEYQTAPDGSVNLHISRCQDLHGSDSLDYALLHQNPDSYRKTFFQHRLEQCYESEDASKFITSVYEMYGFPTLFFALGEYTFDPDGRLTSYNIRDNWNGHSNATIRYDTCGRIAEMRADTGMLAQWRNLIPHACTYVRYAYDSHGNPTKITYEDSHGRTQTVTYRYTYDHYGNWTCRRRFVNGKKDGEDRRVITYE